MNKIETEIKNPSPYEIVSYDSNIDNLSRLKKIADSAYQTNLDFFTRGVNDIKINFVYSDDELKKIAKDINLEYQDWHENYAFRKTVWISSPHVTKGKNCQRGMTHEIAHIFTNNLFYEGSPSWLREGIANVVANRNTDDVFKSNIEFKRAHNGLNFQKHPIYDKSTVFTRYLIDEFGKDRLFILLGFVKEKIGTNNTYDGFTRLFSKIYEVDFEKLEDKFMERRTT